MAYRALRFDAAADAAEAWCDALLDAGALSVDVADPDAGTPTRRRSTASPAGCLRALADRRA